MAQTLENIRALHRTTVHGRRLGITQQEFLGGVKDVKHVVTDATSLTTGTNLPNHGYITLTSSNAREWTINDPEVGVPVTLTVTSSSTLLHTITPANATFVTSGSSTGASMILQGGGTGVTLIGLTTALYGTASGSPGSTYIDFTT